MATTHVFIVDTRTFDIHLRYLFAGTGAGECVINFNNSFETPIHFATENNLLGMIADGSRIREGDFILFYLQQNFSEGVYEGKFYGIFQAASRLFLDNNDGLQYLKNDLGKSLTFRVLIKPYLVYPKGVSEYNALDNIACIQEPNQMCWSLIYRKLKGNRGNTMITLYESEYLRKWLAYENQSQAIYDCFNQPNSFYFDKESQTIKACQNDAPTFYDGRQEPISILPRLLTKYNKGNQFETHLQAYILQNLENLLPSWQVNWQINWIGNEVSCGVGMQRIDILIDVIDRADNLRKIIPIELKSTPIYGGISCQLQRYCDWLKQYYLPNHSYPRIVPMIIARAIDKTSREWQFFKDEILDFNNRNQVMLQYIEFSINGSDISFEKIQYTSTK
ncbi:hypothetical protein [Helicobacter cetorum]|uniref:DUF91 domain-containing protein n=1 Tax=Helicobacter cetorum (strain ATCC BAA-429 / MIT 00-7128) TaxID=182217 RepID=I0EKE5_HELC0|nr:hypothetical protein [Helicobacter cetorum]AFI03414.1 hypothetical protein HCW_00605 [Helicobacter cetorum MIT 00-7128]